MKTGCIYLATLNDKSYIGHTTDFENRKRQHRQASTEMAFHNAIRKYGADAIEWRILEDDIPEHRLPDREELWIAFYDTYFNGYNLTEGGEVSPLSNPETAQRVADAVRQRVTDGTHNFLGDKNPNKRRLEDGTHNFQTQAVHPSHLPGVPARRERTKRRNKGIQDWIDIMDYPDEG